MYIDPVIDKNIREHSSPFSEYPSQHILSLWYTRRVRDTPTNEYRVLQDKIYSEGIALWSPQ